MSRLLLDDACAVSLTILRLIDFLASHESFSILFLCFDCFGWCHIFTLLRRHAMPLPYWCADYAAYCCLPLDASFTPPWWLLTYADFRRHFPSSTLMMMPTLRRHFAAAASLMDAAMPLIIRHAIAADWELRLIIYAIDTRYWLRHYWLVYITIIDADAIWCRHCWCLLILLIFSGHFSHFFTPLSVAAICLITDAITPDAAIIFSVLLMPLHYADYHFRLLRFHIWFRAISLLIISLLSLRLRHYWHWAATDYYFIYLIICRHWCRHCHCHYAIRYFSPYMPPLASSFSVAIGAITE